MTNFAKMKVEEIGQTLRRFGQDRVHQNLGSQMYNAPNDWQIIQQNHAFAIIYDGRTHHIVGDTDEGKVFIHSLPMGQIDYASESMGYILRYINRIDEGFARVQGDLLVRKLDAAEVEDMKRLEKEKGVPWRSSTTLGNGHNIDANIVSSQTNRGDIDSHIVKNDKNGQVNIYHSQHSAISSNSNREEYREVTLQRRDGHDSGGGAD